MLDVAGDEIVRFCRLGAFQKAIVSVVGRDSQRRRWFNQFGYDANRFHQCRHRLRWTAEFGAAQDLFVFLKDDFGRA